MEPLQQIQDHFESLSPSFIYWSVVICAWIQYFLEIYVCHRQRRVLISNQNRIPLPLRGHMSPEVFEKARLYTLDKINFSIDCELYKILLLTGFLHFELYYVFWNSTESLLTSFGHWPSTWDVEIGRTICYFILKELIFDNLVTLPVSLYSDFVIEEKHGFNKKSIRIFFKDLLLGILVNLLFTPLLIASFIAAVKNGGPYFFLWIWLSSFFLILFFMAIYPILIAPLFDTYSSLKEGPLRQRIEALASKLDFPLAQIYVVDGSKKSAHSNAYLFGVFNKRIVLYDTLIKGYGQPAEEGNQEEDIGCKDSEVEAVLAHELGHWKLNHVWKLMAFAEVQLFLTICFFALFYESSVLFEAFGFPKDSNMPIYLGFVFVTEYLLDIFNTVMGCIGNILSRYFEYEADAFAAKLGYGKDLKSALVKLSKDNLDFPIVDQLYSAEKYTHPTLLERLQAINETRKSM